MHQNTNIKEPIGVGIKVFNMAIIFGKPSKYLKGMAAIHTVAAFLYAVIGLYTVWSVVSKNQAQLLDPVGLFVILIVFGPLLVFSYRQYKKHDYGSTSFLKGLRGEGSVSSLLKDALNDNYSVYCDVVIDPKFGNIDYAVIGPTGLFTIEVKSHRGEIGFNGKQITKNGQLFEKDILGQSMGQAISLHDFLLEKLKVDIFVKPVIVFSGYARMHFGFNSVRNVRVIQKHWLTKLLTEEKLYSFPTERQVIEQQLITLVTKDKTKK